MKNFVSALKKILWQIFKVICCIAAFFLLVYVDVGFNILMLYKDINTSFQEEISNGYKNFSYKVPKGLTSIEELDFNKNYDIEINENLLNLFPKELPLHVYMKYDISNNKVTYPLYGITLDDRLYNQKDFNELVTKARILKTSPVKYTNKIEEIKNASCEIIAKQDEFIIFENYMFLKNGERIQVISSYLFIDESVFLIQGIADAQNKEFQKDKLRKFILHELKCLYSKYSLNNLSIFYLK